MKCRHNIDLHQWQINNRLIKSQLNEIKAFQLQLQHRQKLQKRTDEIDLNKLRQKVSNLIRENTQLKHETLVHSKTHRIPRPDTNDRPVNVRQLRHLVAVEKQIDIQIGLKRQRLEELKLEIKAKKSIQKIKKQKNKQRNYSHDNLNNKQFRQMDSLQDELLSEIGQLSERIKLFDDKHEQMKQRFKKFMKRVK